MANDHRDISTKFSPGRLKRPYRASRRWSRREARRYLHIFGPTTAEGFARWAGISRRYATNAFASLDGSLLPVRSPLGDEWLLADDEPAMRAAETAAAPARLLPSGDAYFLLDGAERELLVPRADQRGRLWTPRVWPGALLVEGEIRGTWRRCTTPCGSTPGRACRVGGATRSRPKPAPCPFQVSSGVSRWSGTHELALCPVCRGNQSKPKRQVRTPTSVRVVRAQYRPFAVGTTTKGLQATSFESLVA
jgi:DNA glycosylase AlkZ-like